MYKTLKMYKMLKMYKTYELQLYKLQLYKFLNKINHGWIFPYTFYYWCY